MIANDAITLNSLYFQVQCFSEHVLCYVFPINRHLFIIFMVTLIYRILILSVVKVKYITINHEIKFSLTLKQKFNFRVNISYKCQ
jgi:hypothetical protein